MTTPLLGPICLFCARLVEGVPGEPPHCTAFPGGIPSSVWLEAADHRKAVDGDKGVRFAMDELKRNEFRLWERAREALA